MSAFYGDFTMTHEDARAYLNYLLTLNLRQEEAFGPLALAFIKDNDLGQLGLLPEEQFNLFMSTCYIQLSFQNTKISILIKMLQKPKRQGS